MIRRLYREYCETESVWVTKTTEDEVLTDEFVCPTDAGHTVRDGSLVLVNEANEQCGMNSANGLQLANGADRGKVNITADRLEIEGVVFLNVSLVADLNASGANGLDTGSEQADKHYSVLVACEEKGNPDSLISLLSLSATDPAMPGDETNKYRVGWVRNNGDSNIYRFINAKGDDWFWWNENTNAGDFNVLYQTTSVTLNTWIPFACAAVVPSTSKEVMMYGYITKGADGALHLKLRNPDTSNIGTGVPSVYAQTWYARGLGAQLQVGCDSSQYVQFSSPDNSFGSIRYNVVAYRDIR